VARVFGREALAFKDVSEMGAACGAGDLCPHAVRIRGALHRSRDFRVEAWPSALGVELVIGTIQRGFAAPADVDAFLPVGLILAREGPLGALMNNDARLFRRQGIELFHGKDNILTRTMSRNAGVAFVVASAACYGAMPIFARLAYSSGVSPVTLLFLRFAFAAPVMLVLLAFRRVRLPRGAALLALIGLGGVIYVVQALCYFTALTRAPASLVALILYLYPVLVAVGAAVMYKERFSATRAVALALALCGAALMIGFDRGGTAAGVALAVAAATIYAVYILAGTRVMRNVPALAAAAVVVCSTACVYGGMTAVQGPVWPATISGWLAVAALSLVSTVAAIALFFAGLERVGPTSASILSTLEPAVAVVLAAALLGEAITPARVAGGVLILGAVLLTTRTGAREERVPARIDRAV